MAESGTDDLSTSVGAVLIERGGAMLVDVVTTDYERFASSLIVLRNIDEQVVGEPSDEIYRGSFWLLDMHRSAAGAIYAGDADGNVHTNASGSWMVEPVTPGLGIRVVRCLPDGSVFAAGAAGTVHRRDPDGWVPVSENFGQWITGLDGRSATDLVVAGDAGLVAQLSGSNWERIALPTDITFHAVLAFGGDYLVSGASGALFAGSGPNWQDRTSTSSDLHAMSIYESDVWIACGSDGVGRLGADGIENVRHTFAAYVMHAEGSFICFGGNDVVARFDGTNWRGRRYG